MRRTIIDGQKYEGRYVIPSYTFREGNYSETQIVATKDGMKKSKYIDFTTCCLVAAEEDDVVITARRHDDKIYVQMVQVEVNDIVQVNNTQIYSAKVLFEGSIEQYEEMLYKKNKLRLYEDAVTFAVGNLYSLIGGFYVNSNR